MIIHHIPSIIPKLFPNCIWHKSRSVKKIYLTFDDGPVEGITDFILDILQKRNLSATFFMVGNNIQKNKSLAQRVVREGHHIGNHTFHHLNGYRTNTEEYLNDISKCQSAIMDELGKTTNLFRPPYGRITKQQFQKVKESYELVMWDVLSGDFDPDQSAQRCLHKTIQYCQNGSIIVFHDQNKTKGIIQQILEPFLDYVQANGYETALL